MYNIFDEGLVEVNINGYRAQVVPELYPKIRQPVLKNWCEEDKEAYCGGPWTRGYRNR